MGAKIKTAITNTLRMLAALVAVYGAAVLILSLESHAPQAPAVTGKDLPPYSSGQPAALLSHPLPYTATMYHCLPSGRECSAVRYYVPKERK